MRLVTPLEMMKLEDLSNQSGVSYDAIHAYIRSGSSGDAAADAIIRKKERAGAHKRRMPPIADPFTETWI